MKIIIKNFSGSEKVRNWLLVKYWQISTVHAGELGPRGKLGPDNNWLNEIGFFLLLQ